MPSQRQQKLNRIFREELSDLLLRHLKDPRLGNSISVTEVRVAPDLSQAIVFVSPMGDDARRQESLQGLIRAAGHIRSELGHRLRLRRIPEFEFRLDDSQEDGDRMLDLMDKVSRELHEKA
jgi:ribosome-binding factor A